MKFIQIFRFEFAYQLRRPWPWLFMLVLTSLSFLMTRDGALSEVLYAEFYLNSSFAVTKTTVFGSLIWLVMAAAIAGDAAARGVETSMYPLTYTTSVSKKDYVGGLFLAAFVLNALMLLSVQLGILLGVYLPGVEASLIGPFRPAAFATAYVYISLPNAFAATAIQFALANGSGRAMAAYFGSFLIVFMGFFVASFLLYNHQIGTLMDPIGIRFIVEDIAHLWTTVEKNSRLLELEGIVLHNRLFWLAIGISCICSTYLFFRFAHRTNSPWFSLRTKKQHAALLPTDRVPASGAISVPQLLRTFGFTTNIRQLLCIAGESFSTVARSWAGLCLLIVLPLITVPVVLDQMVSRGVPLVPKTIYVISELTGPLSDELSRWVIIPFLILFFAGELVWRERNAGLGELTDSMPGSDWARFLGKFLGLSLVIILFLALQIGAGILAQAMVNYHHIELSLYLQVVLGLQLTEYLLFALLALVVHVVVDHKYIGHLVATIAFVFIAMASLFGIEHNMLIWGASPAWFYTEMRGFGASLEPWLWFKAYWLAWALLLSVVARLFWVRGRVHSIRARLQLARRRFRGATSWAAAAATGAVMMLGGYIFYNTNVLNDYLTSAEIKARQAAYELQYGRYKAIPQPQVVGASLQVDIFPEHRALEISGTYTLRNFSKSPIDTIHLGTVGGTQTKALTFDKAARNVHTNETLGHHMYVLEKPLQPGDSLRLNFLVKQEPKGFTESGIDPAIAENGTYFTLGSLLPHVGYQPERELIQAADRREYGLAPRPLIASLYNLEVLKKQGGGITFETVISTHKDQVAVAPGGLQQTWTKGGRRYFHYVTDGPIGEASFFSARYALHEEQWLPAGEGGKAVNILIFHQPENNKHLERMLRGIRASLDYYTSHFGPYPYSHLSIVERPGRGTGMHADASMITYAEGFSHWQAKEDAGMPDIPFAVVAHEMAHQWTVPYANVEGAPVMSESLAWYYAMQVMKQTQGEGLFRQFLSWMHAPYRREIRRGEPLLRGLDPYMSYRKGPFALYTLSEYIGEAQVNRALRRLLEVHRQKEAPLATTLDLYRLLKAETPDSLQYLLHDLFEVNTTWALEAKEASAEQLKTGDWRLTLAVQASKKITDSAGVESEVPMDDWVEIGVYAAGQVDEPGEKMLYLKKHRIHSGKQVIELIVPKKPARAGIDPNSLLMDADTGDKMAEVK